MGTKEIIILLLMLLLYVSPASLFPLGKTFTSVHLQEERSSTNGSRKLKIAHHSNFGHGAGGRGGEGGRSTGTGEGSNNEGSNTQGAGAAVVPLYTAGAANGRRSTHHSAGSCNKSCVGFPTLCAAILASLLVVVHINGVFGLK